MKAVNCGMIVRYYLMLALVLSALALHGQNKTVINIGEGSGAGSTASCVCDTIKILSSSVNSTSTTFAAIADLTSTVEAGESYVIDLALHVTEIGDGGLRITMDGTATTTTFAIGAHNSIPHYAGSLGGFIVLAIIAELNDQMFIFSGLITVNAGGTLEVQFAQADGGGGTTTISPGSYLRLSKVN